jgi:hypothetical protein
MIQESFNRILSTISYIVHGMGITRIDQHENNSKKGGRKLSLGDAFQLILKYKKFF